METLHSEDLAFIAGALYPGIPPADLRLMIAFNGELHRETMEQRLYGQVRRRMIQCYLPCYVFLKHIASLVVF